MTSQPTSCVHCGANQTREFCEECGEKRFSQSQLSYKSLTNQLFVSLTDLDGKVLQSFRLLLFKPGQLLIDYCQGLRKYRLNPFQLFLFSNILYFFALNVLHQNTFNTPLDVHMNAGNFFHQEIANQWVNQYLRESGLALAEYRQLFDQAINLQSKSLVILLIPIYALIICLLFFRQEYIGIRSLVLSTHFFAFVLIFLITFDLVIGNFLKFASQDWGFKLFDYINGEFFTSVCILVGVMTYLYFAIRRVFIGHWLNHLVKTLILAFGFYLSILVYRSILFFTTYFSILE